MHSEEDLTKAEGFGAWLHERTNGLVFKVDERMNIAEGFFYLAQEHHDAIIVLVRARLYGSAWALARPLLEAYVRGTWLLRHASQAELESFMKGKCPKFNQLITAIGNKPETGGAWLEEIQKKAWPGLNDYTHGGASQISQRFTKDAIESAYSEKILADLFAITREVAIFVAAELFVLAGQESLLEQLGEKAAEIRGQP
jgi:hypothetical protein